MEIELERDRFASREWCRGRARLRGGAEARASRVTATLRGFETWRQPFSSRPPVRRIRFEKSVEMAAALLSAGGEVPFELRVPGPEELEALPEPPAFLRRLVLWLDPEAIGPLRWEVEVRLHRGFRRDAVATRPIEVALAGAVAT